MRLDVDCQAPASAPSEELIEFYNKFGPSARSAYRRHGDMKTFESQISERLTTWNWDTVAKVSSHQATKSPIEYSWFNPRMAIGNNPDLLPNGQ